MFRPFTLLCLALALLGLARSELAGRYLASRYGGQAGQGDTNTKWAHQDLTKVTILSNYPKIVKMFDIMYPFTLN